MAEYDVLIALENLLQEGNMCNLELPRSTVVYLTGTRRTPEELIVHIKAPGGQLRYKIPTLKAFRYNMKELLERGLFLLIPFHILVYKNRVMSYNKDEKELKKLQKIYEDMVERLGQLCSANKLTMDEVTDILRVSAEMVDKVAANCEKVRKAIGDILRGQAYELPTDRLIRQGRQEGISQGLSQGRLEGALDICIGLLKDGVISLAEAARRLSMSEEELKSKML